MTKGSLFDCIIVNSSRRTQSLPDVGARSVCRALSWTLKRFQYKTQLQITKIGKQTGALTLPKLCSSAKPQIHTCCYRLTLASLPQRHRNSLFNMFNHVCAKQSVKTNKVGFCYLSFFNLDGKNKSYLQRLQVDSFFSLSVWCEV